MLFHRCQWAVWVNYLFSATGKYQKWSTFLQPTYGNLWVLLRYILCIWRVNRILELVSRKCCPMLPYSLYTSARIFYEYSCSKISYPGLMRPFSAKQKLKLLWVLCCYGSNFLTPCNNSSLLPIWAIWNQLTSAVSLHVIRCPVCRSYRDQEGSEYSQWMPWSGHFRAIIIFRIGAKSWICLICIEAKRMVVLLKAVSAVFARHSPSAECSYKSTAPQIESLSGCSHLWGSLSPGFCAGPLSTSIDLLCFSCLQQVLRFIKVLETSWPTGDTQQLMVSSKLWFRILVWFLWLNPPLEAMVNNCLAAWLLQICWCKTWKD